MVKQVSAGTRPEPVVHFLKLTSHRCSAILTVTSDFQFCDKRALPKMYFFVCLFVFKIQNGYLNIILDISPPKLLQAG